MCSTHSDDWLKIMRSFFYLVENADYLLTEIHQAWFACCYAL